jgi:phage terminase large subunit-like protein
MFVRIKLPDNFAAETRPKLPRVRLPADFVSDYVHKEVSKYNETKGDRVIKFCNSLRVPSGKDVGKMVVLRDWQCNILKAIYDPVDPDTGLRRIREACITMARKNGKTSLAAMIVLAHLVGPMTQRNGELYSAGFRRDQSAIIWRALYQMISVDDELQFYCTWSNSRKTIDAFKFGTSYRAISAEVKGKHGFNPSLVILDELSQFGGDRALYDVFKTSMGAQDEPLLITISTQAADDLAIMSEIIGHGRQVEANEVDDPSFKLIEYSTDDFDEIHDPEVWKKANPALGDFRSLLEMQQMSERAKTSPSAENTFRNLYLNQRVSSTVSLVPPSIWRANGAEPQNLTVGRSCYIGLDLSDRMDLTCMMLVFPDTQSTFIDVVPLFFTPQDTIEERSKRDRVPYFDWWKQGLLIAVPGKSVDYKWVANKLAEVAQDFDIQLVVFDRWRIKLFFANLELIGFNPETLTWLEHGQGYKDMAPAIDCIEEDLTHIRLRHGMHPVLTFNAGSTKVSKDPAGNRKFDKVRSSGKIDGMVALAMALNAYHSGGENKARSVLEKRGPIVIPGNRDNLTQGTKPRSVWDSVDAA